MNTNEKLFSGFPVVSREHWKAKAVEDLKGAAFDKKLVWKTDDGFQVKPFYTEDDFSENELLKVQHDIVVQGNRSWINYSEVQVADAAKANEQAVEMVSFGATGIVFRLEPDFKFDFEVLLHNIDLEQLHISFSASSPSSTFIAAYIAFVSAKNINLANIKGFYEADVLERYITEGVEADFDELHKVIEACKEATNFRALSIRSHAFINAGANTSQEVAFTLNKLTDYIDKLQAKGLTAEFIASNLTLHLAIAGDYFFEMAKIRAVRILLTSILQQYNLNEPVTILSSNSTWSKSFYDPSVNMLRNTTEAMSAVIGGCDALLTYPHDSTYTQPSSFSRRIALHVSNLIKEESYFNKVSDPAGGSYYIENLTGTLAEHALQLFKEIEEKGGFIEAFKAGVIQQRIEVIRDKKEKEIALRQRVYVGTNKYPNLKERNTFNERATRENKDGVQLLFPRRATKAFEELRNKTLRHFEQTGFIPKVYLACFGNFAMGKARASFSTEFFGTGGFEILGEFFFSDINTAAREGAASNADIVVMCSSDADYEAKGTSFAEIFKSLSKDKILVLAGYPETLVEQLQHAGVDNFIHIRSNAVELLSDLQQKLFFKQLL